MSISITALYADVAQEVGRGIGDERLASSFPRAVNRALDELAVAADLATKFTHISSTSGALSGISENYEYIVYTGTVYWLIRAGYKPSDPNTANLLLQDTTNRWREAKDDYVQDLDNIAQAVDGADVIGLGDVS